MVVAEVLHRLRCIGRKPETTSFEVLWSKESNPGNWMINKDQGSD